MASGVNLAAAGVALILGGCAVTQPVAVVGKGVPGGIMRGSVTASMMGGGTFSVTNGKLSCSGSYNSLDSSVTITMPVLCNDGRSGILTATRDASGQSGGGTFTLTDGTSGQFIFGPAAARL